VHLLSKFANPLLSQTLT